MELKRKMPNPKRAKSLRSLKGKRVIVRTSLNVPIKQGVVQNDFRIKRALPTIKWLREKDAKVVLVSHLGSDGKKSLRDVVEYMRRFTTVGFLPNENKERRNRLVEKMSNGSVFVLENVRKIKGEMENSKEVAKDLASFGDIYINDDFAVSHRKHASVCAITELLPSYEGPLLEEEIKELSKAFKPKKPFVVILGGAKFETKLPLVKSFINKADKIFIVGALANSFFKEKGYETGKSLVDSRKLGLATLMKNKKIILPVDVVVKNRGGVRVKKPDEVTKLDNILDNGPETVERIVEEVKDAKMILWNGPIGKFEDGFSESTEKVAKAIAKSKGHSIVGGGDSVSAISKLGLLKKFSFVSTGGGAMLDFLADQTIPGLEALKKSKVK